LEGQLNKNNVIGEVLVACHYTLPSLDGWSNFNIKDGPQSPSNTKVEGFAYAANVFVQLSREETMTTPTSKKKEALNFNERLGRMAIEVGGMR
jgi:hypothetical protein